VILGRRTTPLVAALVAAATLAACGAPGPSTDERIGYGDSQLVLRPIAIPHRYHLSFVVQNTGTGQESISCHVEVLGTRRNFLAGTVTLPPGGHATERTTLSGLRAHANGAAAYQIVCGPA
jgi:hypothetical protein